MLHLVPQRLSQAAHGEVQPQPVEARHLGREQRERARRPGSVPEAQVPPRRLVRHERRGGALRLGGGGEGERPGERACPRCGRRRGVPAAEPGRRCWLCHHRRADGASGGARSPSGGGVLPVDAQRLHAGRPPRAVPLEAGHLRRGARRCRPGRRGLRGTQGLLRRAVRRAGLGDALGAADEPLAARAASAAEPMAARRAAPMAARAARAAWLLRLAAQRLPQQGRRELEQVEARPVGGRERGGALRLGGLLPPQGQVRRLLRHQRRRDALCGGGAEPGPRGQRPREHRGHGVGGGAERLQQGLRRARRGAAAAREQGLREGRRPAVLPDGRRARQRR
mmetsp:Transcript_86286/g.231449  ORF Transcript_86286/g.231449 Transcript_86286/m.231449 type:complete len:338 (+) Transcript_86286:615-1628(+)